MCTCININNLVLLVNIMLTLQLFYLGREQTDNPQNGKIFTWTAGLFKNNIRILCIAASSLNLFISVFNLAMIKVILQDLVM